MNVTNARMWDATTVISGLLMHARATEPFLWQPNPTFRGTVQIFSLCLSTLVITVWSAVHADIPIYRPTKFRGFLNSLSWMLAALFCPELLMFIAFNQRSNAIAVHKKASGCLVIEKRRSAQPALWRRILFQNTKASLCAPEGPMESDNALSGRKHPFTMVHAFYAAMGGFVFELYEDEENPAWPPFLPAGRTRMALSPAGVQFLMEHDPDLIPDIEESSISDRTKASSLSKTIALAQVAWFCLNCISRLAQDLPLSLLEVSTVAHGLCTLVTYMLWFNKPLNVSAPTVITGRRARELCALMAMCSPTERHTLYGVACLRVPAEMQSITTALIQDDKEEQSSAVNSKSGQNEGQQQDEPHGRPPSSVTLIPEKLYLDETNFTPKRESPIVPFYHGIKTRLMYWNLPLPWHVPQRVAGAPVSLLPEDVERWGLAYAAMQRYGIEDPPRPEKPLVLAKSSLKTSTDFKSHGLKGIVRSNLSATALALIYGCPHFLGWNARFPTAAEETLWRIATVAISFWGITMAALVALIIVIRFSLGIYTGERKGETLLVAGMAVPYIATSGYLLFESLRQLFFLEPTAYDLPSWSNYVPHIS